jgi:hypothetical protein
MVRHPRVYSAGVRRLAALSLIALSLGACGNTLQSGPIPHNLLEDMILAPYPVYWLGGSFQHMPISEVTHDVSDAFSVQYGNCAAGGEGACVPLLRVVTSPDNSFLPGGSAPARRIRIRGVQALLAQAGKTIVIATGTVVVDIYAANERIALAAAQTVVPINALGAPQQPLAAALPNSGFGETPLPSQVPKPLHALG